MEYKFGSYGVQCYGGNLVEDGRLADFPLVGSNVKASSELCNVFSRNLGCLEGHKHAGMVPSEGLEGTFSFDGKITDGQAVIYARAYHCSDPLCPSCCYAWAKKEAKRAMLRFGVFELMFKEFELRHIMVSVPSFDWGKSLEFMRKQVAAFSGAVGVVGSMCIYHPKRYSDELDCWYFSPHFHLLGYVAGGQVDGLLVSEIYHKTGYVLTNFESRKSVVGTILYQLSHAGVPQSKKARACTVTWLGDLKFNRKHSPELYELLVQEERNAKFVDRRKVCPVCGGVMKHVCRVASAPVGFNYGAVEERYVLDPVCNWVVVPDLVYRGKGGGLGEE